MTEMIETKDPCINCSNKVIDEWGYFCDVSCGKRALWLTYEAGFKTGIKEVVKWIQSINPNYPDVPIGVAFSTWQSKLKEWGIE